MSYPIEGTPRHDEILFEVIQAASSSADRFALSIETETVADDYPSIIRYLDDRFSRIGDNDTVRYEADVSERSLEVIELLLEMTGSARIFGVRKIELARDSETCLRYVPEHEDFTITGDSSGEVIAAVQNAIDVEPAVILPNRVLVEWKVTGTECSISPPSLCVGNVCHDLSRLASVESHPEQLEIELRWYESEQGHVGQIISWAASQVGLSRPDTLRFESTAELSEAVEVLQTVTAGTGKEVL
ncbi:hypothetical protein [Halorussus pelagicus]|uniref:hypothetical protein n=1 Tax=Halorussus pelagicus TaxID=2505977 RepID=UPI000FFC459E|nr:hypothetical protein [Halorussus pelagicus]